MTTMARFHASPPASTERCRQLLNRWRSDLHLSAREQGALRGDLQLLDRQLERLEQRRLRIAVFGRVGVGKSSLINALVGKPVLATDIAHGCTRRQQAVPWPITVPELSQIELIDTPGIDEIDATGRERLARRVALGADLVLLVLDSDLTSTDHDALNTLLASGKPLQLVLNRSDRWGEEALPALIASIESRLPQPLPLTVAAAAPRQPAIDSQGRVYSETAPSRVATLRQRLQETLMREGGLLLALQSLRQADRFQQARQRLRLQQHRRTAQSLIGRYAAAKATGVAMNPVLAIDLAGGVACDTALVIQLCRLYGLPLAPASARQLLRRLSTQNSLLGGIQISLSALKQLLLVLAPISGGISLAPAAPIALAQAALAVHSTKRTGQLVAHELLKGLQRGGGQPAALLNRLAQNDPVIHHWLKRWHPQHRTDLQPLLP